MPDGSPRETIYTIHAERPDDILAETTRPIKENLEGTAEYIKVDTDLKYRAGLALAEDFPGETITAEDRLGLAHSHMFLRRQVIAEALTTTAEIINVWQQNAASLPTSPDLITHISASMQEFGLTDAEMRILPEIAEHKEVLNEFAFDRDYVGRLVEQAPDDDVTPQDLMDRVPQYVPEVKRGLVGLQKGCLHIVAGVMDEYKASHPGGVELSAADTELWDGIKQRVGKLTSMSRIFGGFAEQADELADARVRELEKPRDDWKNAYDFVKHPGTLDKETAEKIEKGEVKPTGSSVWNG